MSTRTKLTDEQYAELKGMPPEDRIHSCGDKVKDRIMGILVAYSAIYDLRDGWVDIITIRDAEDEIKQLILDCGGDLNAI